jgi:hypothetical protein
MSKAGGGIKSNKVVHKPVRTGQPAHSKGVAGVSQIGSQMGNRAMNDPKTMKGGVESWAGSVIPGVGTVPLGNQVAATTQCGPGGSRQVYGSGAQAMHGPANPGNAPAKNRDILGDFGPDVPGRR